MPVAPPRLAPGRIAPGTQLNGIYQIDQRIASGGMGEVYRGHAIQTGDEVAIKVLLPDFAESEIALALFRREASALHNLYHDAIVRYYVFTIEPVLQCPYLAMEFVEGQSLSALVEDGPLPFDSACALMHRVASGLHAAHERRIIHRDVSPDNIIVPDGQVSRAKIIDFGIARSTELGESTIIGSGFAGKYNYVSPEQLGLYGGDVTAKSDIYSLGLVAAQALTGSALDMGGSQFDIIEKRRSVPELGNVDRRARTIIEAMLQPDPARRPESMLAVGEAFAQRTQPLPRGSRKGPAPEPIERVPPRSWRGKAVAGGLACILLVGAAVGYQRYGRQKEIPVEPPSRAREFARFIQLYQGGDCFFVTTASVTSTAISVEGYGISLAAFKALDEAFQRAHRVEPDIGVWQVAPAQCGAVNFLSALRASRDEPPKLQLSAASVREGGLLRGTVTSGVHGHIDLLTVSDSGAVRNVSAQMVSNCATPCTRAGAGFDFSITVPRNAAREGQPQLLVAVSGSEGLAALRAEDAPSAAQVFPRALVEAAQKGQPLAASVKYFKIER